MTFIFIFLIGLLGLAHGESICDILKIDNCAQVSRQIRRSSGGSLPSTATATNLNPANVSHDKGLGAEFIASPGNPMNISLVTGTGRIGGAFLSSNLENSFFGNRVVEIDESREERESNKKQFPNDKVSIGLSAALYKSPTFGLDFGIVGKRHSEIRRINAGTGLSGRLGFLTFGASYYQDDVYFELGDYVNPETNNQYRNELGSTSYQEKFMVQNYTAGLRLKNLILDYGIIQSKYKFTQEETTVSLISLSYLYDNFLLNLAKRNENSPYYTKLKGIPVKKNNRDEVYGGAQVSVAQFLILGLHYNYFLLKEVAFSATVFF